MKLISFTCAEDLDAFDVFSGQRSIEKSFSMGPRLKHRVIDHFNVFQTKQINSDKIGVDFRSGSCG